MRVDGCATITLDYQGAGYRGAVVAGGQGEVRGGSAVSPE
jgi:hypothetical protein